MAAALAACPGGGAPLPSGGILTPRGLQLLGLPCLGLGGGFDRLHYLLERALDPPGLGGEGGSGGGLGAPRRVSRAFLRGFEALMAWDTNPLYAVLHESIYANGEPVAESGIQNSAVPVFCVRVFSLPHALFRRSFQPSGARDGRDNHSTRPHPLPLPHSKHLFSRWRPHRVGGRARARGRPCARGRD